MCVLLFLPVTNSSIERSHPADMHPLIYTPPTTTLHLHSPPSLDDYMSALGCPGRGSTLNIRHTHTHTHTHRRSTVSSPGLIDLARNTWAELSPASRCSTVLLSAPPPTPPVHTYTHTHTHTHLLSSPPHASSSQGCDAVCSALLFWLFLEEDDGIQFPSLPPSAWPDTVRQPQRALTGILPLLFTSEPTLITGRTPSSDPTAQPLPPHKPRWSLDTGSRGRLRIRNGVGAWETWRTEREW